VLQVVMRTVTGKTASARHRYCRLDWVIRQDFAEAVRPVFFQTEDEEFFYATNCALSAAINKILGAAHARNESPAFSSSGSIPMGRSQ
jgi:hypothetical protein